MTDLIKDNQPLQYQQADIFYNLENHPQVPLPFDPQYNNLAINDLKKGTINQTPLRQLRLRFQDINDYYMFLGEWSTSFKDNCNQPFY